MTAPLLSPTDISPGFDWDDWLHPQRPAARNTPPPVDFAGFAAALTSRTFSFDFFSTPPGNPISLPTKALPYTGASGNVSSSELPAQEDGVVDAHPTYSSSQPALDQQAGWMPDPFIAGFNRDMMEEQQACYNSLTDITSNHKLDPPLQLEHAAFQSFHGNMDWMVANDTPETLRLPVPSHFEPQTSVDNIATSLAWPEDSWQYGIDTTSGTNYESHQLSHSPWTTSSNHELKTGNDCEQGYDMAQENNSVPTSLRVSPVVFNRPIFLHELHQPRPRPPYTAAVEEKEYVSFSLSAFAITKLKPE